MVAKVGEPQRKPEGSEALRTAQKGDAGRSPVLTPSSTRLSTAPRKACTAAPESPELGGPGPPEDPQDNLEP